LSRIASSRVRALDARRRVACSILGTSRRVRRA
jgi:hypothetical protein